MEFGSEIRHRRDGRWWPVALIALVSVFCSTPPAVGSTLHLLAPSTTAFATDGSGFAAWEVQGRGPIVVLDTRTGERRDITVAGCSLEDSFETRPTGGRFLLSCSGGQRLLDVLSMTTVALPGSHRWERAGTRYLEGSAMDEDCRPSTLECVAFYDIATGQVSLQSGSSAGIRQAEPANLDAPGAPAEYVCKQPRRSLRIWLGYASFGDDLDYSMGVLVHRTHDYRNVILERCNGASTFLPGPNEPTESGERP